MCVYIHVYTNSLFSITTMTVFNKCVTEEEARFLIEFIFAVRSMDKVPDLFKGLLLIKEVVCLKEPE